MDVTVERLIAGSTAIGEPRVPQGLEASTAARSLLAIGVIAGAGVAAVLPAASVGEIDPDLVRLIRFMAALKGGLLIAALWAGAWRLGRSAPIWRTTVYVCAPALMAFGTLALWRVQVPGLAAAALHLGLVAFLATSLTDRDFIPSRRTT
ncbi:MAG: hypothetical protein K2Y56_05495 [Methylobacterium sp.]|uniref:hypothetical protein n=1 Tax=Methylobacterium sp. TaxID=409 RepID=UPI0025FDF8FD|nr:hypothetical protein [Methylobacterium sp.]MBX9930978.1 hypothetical protein [Methylobacterium sp.]